MIGVRFISLRTTRAESREKKTAREASGIGSITVVVHKDPAYRWHSTVLKMLGKAKRRAIRYNEHLTGDGSTVFRHVYDMGLEGIVSKRTDAKYRSGPSKVWLKTKNPASDAVRREREEGWR